MGKTIGIISLKGGVGKTSVVSALGAAMAKEFGKKVLVVDANFSAPNLGLHVGLVNQDTTIHHVLSGMEDVKKAIYETDYGFHILPGSLIYEKVDPLKLKDHLKKIKNHYDAILIDSSPTLNDEILATMVASDELFVVTTPDHVTLSTTLRAVKLAKESNTPIKGLILNKVLNKSFELSLEDIEEAANCPVLAVLPYETGVLKALSMNTPSTLYKKSGTTHEYKHLAAALLGETYNDRRLSQRLRYLFGRVPRQVTNREAFRENLCDTVFRKVFNK